MPQILLRANGQAPYTYRTTNLAGTLIQQIIEDDEQVLIEIGSGGFSYLITDALGRTRSDTYDAVSMNWLRRPVIGHNIPNSDAVDSSNGITNAQAKGHNSVGFVFNPAKAGYMNTDAEFNSSIWTQNFDHVSGTASVPFDTLVKEAKQKSVGLRVMIDYTRPYDELNGSAGRSQMFGSNDVMLRANGQWVTRHDSSFHVVRDVVGSIAAGNYYNYCLACDRKFLTRYRNAINDGTIVFVTEKHAQTAESHFEFQLIYNGNDEGTMADGDYHPLMVSGFQEFSQGVFVTVGAFNSRYGTSISNWTGLTASLLSSGGNNTPLRQYWYWYRSYRYIQFTHQKMAAAHAAVPGITRTKYRCLDMGEIGDSLGAGRGNWNIQKIMAHPLFGWIKVNPLVQYPQEISCELARSTAYSFGGACIVEPTDGNFSREGFTQDLAAHFNVVRQRGAGVSFINSPNQMQAAYDIANLGTYTASVPQNNVVDGNGNLRHFDVLLSQIITHGGVFSSNIRDAWTAQNCPNIRIIDDVDPRNAQT